MLINLYLLLLQTDYFPLKTISNSFIIPNDCDVTTDDMNDDGCCFIFTFFGFDLNKAKINKIKNNKINHSCLVCAESFTICVKLEGESQTVL